MRTTVCRSWLVLLAMSPPSVAAFLGPSLLTTCRQHHYHLTPTSCRTSKIGFDWQVSRLYSNDDDDDGDSIGDFFADYNPEEYEKYNRQYSYDPSSSSDGQSDLQQHDYKRDTSEDTSNVDEATVNRLLAERLQARKTGQFGIADSIRDELLEQHGVSIWDREKLWRSGCSASGSGKHWQKRKGRPQRPERDFGPLGHDYQLASDAGPNQSSLTDDEIHARLAKRLQCKLNRDFATADRIQDELLQAGVRIHDGFKEWRADGVMVSDRQDGNSYRQSPYSESPQDSDAIQELVDRRLAAKASRDYKTADSIRDQLRLEWNVWVDDRKKQWSLGGEFGEKAPRRTRDRFYYTQSQYSRPTSHAQEIDTALNARSKAKQERDFATADEIREELFEEYDVVIDDRRREWSVGGNFGGDDRFVQRRQDPSGPPRPYIRRGGGGLSDEELETITSLVQERVEAKQRRDYDLADELRDTLRNTYLVSIDDRNREWRLMSDDYVQSDGSPELEPDVLEIVQEKLVQRTQAKANRDYDTADAIREELLEMYSVAIDDRTREWKVIVWEEDRDRDSITEQYPEASEEAIENYQDESSETDPDITDEGNGSVEEDLSSLTVVELKEKLREVGLPVSGKKAELVDRLLSQN